MGTHQKINCNICNVSFGKLEDVKIHHSTDRNHKWKLIDVWREVINPGTNASNIAIAILQLYIESWAIFDEKAMALVISCRLLVSHQSLVVQTLCLDFKTNWVLHYSLHSVHRGIDIQKLDSN